MKGINSTGAPLVPVPGWMDGWVGGWVGGWMGVTAVLRIAYSNQKFQLTLLHISAYTIVWFVLSLKNKALGDKNNLVGCCHLQGVSHQLGLVV
jgi:hypothetical protein